MDGGSWLVKWNDQPGITREAVSVWVWVLAAGCPAEEEIIEVLTEECKKKKNNQYIFIYFYAICKTSFNASVINIKK